MIVYETKCLLPLLQIFLFVEEVPVCRTFTTVGLNSRYTEVPSTTIENTIRVYSKKKKKPNRGTVGKVKLSRRE